jgi:KipI family sensor histidine kinase inhibitor
MAGDRPPLLLPCGDGAISVEFGGTVDPALSRRVLALDAELAASPFPGLVEAVPTYRSLHLQFDPVATDVEALEAHVLALALRLPEAVGPARRWRVPVLYGGDDGIDLETLARMHDLSTAEVVRLHAGRVYRLYMIGFLPGFAYLGGLDERLHTPRRREPRPVIPAQSIAIGGAQTAIGSMEGPSGWHLIGRTPARPFQRGRDPVFLFEAGDEIVFEPIAKGDWGALDRAAARGEPVVRREPA